MVTAVHVIYAAAHLAMLWMSIRLFARDRRWTLLALAVTIAGLVYDNLVLGLGSLIGPGATLMSLNYPRFVIGAITLPLLGMLGLDLARNTTIEWAWTRRAAVSFWLLTLSMLAWGLAYDVVSLRMVLTPTDAASYATEALRYTNDAVKGPPLPALTVMTLLMFCGIGVFVRTRWPWLLVNAIIMFTVAAFASGFGIVANLGELVLIVGLVLTAQRFPMISRVEALARQKKLTPADRERLADEQRGRKRRLAVGNRYMAWVMAPLLIVGTLAFYRQPLGLTFLTKTIDSTANSAFLILFFIHATASFYFYGVPRPKPNIRVVHVYIGYGVFIFTMISQSFLHTEPLHIITYVLNWVFIGAHIALSIRFMLKRVTRQKQDPMLEIVISKKLATSGD
ncbi:MAG: hypothetical protein WCI67_19865 [Chloroflexales bacterium]